MNRLVIDLDTPSFIVEKLRFAADATMAMYPGERAVVERLADAFEAAAGKRYVVLDPEALGFTLATPRNLRQVAARDSLWSDHSRVLREVADQLELLDPRADSRVQRVLDVAAETGADIEVETARRIADVLLPERSA